MIKMPGDSILPTRVIYIGPFRFPQGDAGAQRVLVVGRAMRNLGIEVEFCGWRNKTGESDTRFPSVEEFDGFKFRCLPEFRAGSETRLGRLKHHLTEGSLSLAWLKQFLTRGDFVVIFPWYNFVVLDVIEYCKKVAIPVVVDSMEWYDPLQCAGGRFGLHRWEVEYCLRRGFFRADGIFAISAFLQRHYRERLPTLRLPPLIDTTEPKWNAGTAGELQAGATVKLCYCGVPGKKDNLARLFGALSALGEPANRLSVTLVGPTGALLDGLLAEEGIQRFRNTHCLGKLPHLEALKIVHAAHFSVLIRPNRRYAHAGFSTKFVESLALGTPPFCNVTSDIGEYTRDGTDSLHLRSDSIEDILAGLRRVIALKPETHAGMRLAARAAAARAFDWRAYKERLRAFLISVSTTVTRSIP